MARKCFYIYCKILVETVRFQNLPPHAFLTFPNFSYGRTTESSDEEGGKRFLKGRRH